MATKAKYFKRPHLGQVWKEKGSEVFLINLNPEGKFHYNGGSDIFFDFKKDGGFDLKSHKVAITEKEFNQVREEWIKRIAEF